jgi:SNF2-related domain/SNF2 Helicase protein/Helicase conserved C-terminal domain
MLVVHGFWSPDRGLCLWAEDSALPVRSGSQALRSARPHPFAAPAASLAAVHAGQPDQAVLLLPSWRSAPLDSPELIRVTPRRQPRQPAQARPALLAWQVPVIALEPAAALAVLATPAADVRYGASFGYLARVAAFATDLVSRGRVLPAVARDLARPAARWRPFLQGHDVMTVQALARAMPPACRAEPGRDDPYEQVTAMLAALADVAAREALSGVPSLVPPGQSSGLPAAEAWLAALTSPDGRFGADPGELDALAEALRPWDEEGAGLTGPARVTFRLTEDDHDQERDPGADGGQWQLEFLLQSMADPSLLVPADRVWAGDGNLSRWLARPQELLLGELGRACRVYPELAGGLRQPQPCALGLGADGAYHFLASAAPALDEAGFGVLLPSWWDRKHRLGLAGSASTPVDGVVAGAGRFGRDQLLDFRWQLAVGDHTLTDAEITALAQAKAPLVRLRGQWVAVDRDQLRRGLEFLARQRSGQVTAAEVMRLAVTHPDDLDAPLPLAGVTADGWLGEFLNGAAPQSVQAVTLPGHFQATLRPYQERGLAWLAFLSSLGLGACLADDMGLGKTVQLLALETAHRGEDPACGPSLLLCPMSLVGNWEREAARFTPGLRVYAHHGPQRLHGDDLAARLAGADLVLTTYATATRDADELSGYRWQRVVLDEAQAIKNSLSQAAKAAKRMDAGHRVALTGTPVENRLAELWSIMDFLNPGLLGSSGQFRARYAIPVERRGEAEPAQRLRAVTRPYLLRRLKTDPAIISDLPQKMEIKQYCQLTTEQASLYQAVVDDMMDKISGSDGIERRGNVLAAMAKLKQVCNHPGLLLHDRSAVGRRSGKVIRLEELLEEILAGGDRVLCFTQFTEFAQMLLPHLAARLQTDISYLHGGTSRPRRDELVTRFQSGEGPPVFLLSLKAGGAGLNLTAASHVIHLDRWWNPAVENQATDRAFRIGQTRNVQVRKFICAGTLEEKIDQMIEEKKALADLVVSDGEGWLTELSTGELQKVFALSQEAVGE